MEGRTLDSPTVSLDAKLVMIVITHHYFRMLVNSSDLSRFIKKTRLQLMKYTQ
jgi:hypothetical protein